jgi:hypothetical protein
VTGGVAAGTRVARGIVRAATSVTNGDARGAPVEAAAGLAAPGLAAPGVAAVQPVSLPGSDVCQAAAVLTAAGREQAGPTTEPVDPPGPCQRRRPQATTVNANAA